MQYYNIYIFFFPPPFYFINVFCTLQHSPWPREINIDILPVRYVIIYINYSLLLLLILLSIVLRDNWGARRWCFFSGLIGGFACENINYG